MVNSFRIMKENPDETVNTEPNPTLVIRCITHRQNHWPTAMYTGGFLPSKLTATGDLIGNVRHY